MPLPKPTVHPYAETVPTPTDHARSASEAGPAFRFNLHELSGSLGDLGTFLPLVLAMALSTRLDLGLMLIAAGVANILTGLVFRQPIPVQPMKAIAAVAIAEGLLADQIVAAGLLMGLFMVVLAVTGLVDRIDRWIPRPVVRGIQIGVGVKLALRGVTWLGGLPAVGVDSWLVVLAVVLALLVLMRFRQPALLYIFLAGMGLSYLISPETFHGMSFQFPTWRLHWPSLGAWDEGLFRGALPQLPLTLLNSVVAVCALSADYFPGRGIAPRRMAASVGLMNLMLVPLGGLPMCHGSGGLAAQYQFGARTGGSVIMLGAMKVAVGVLLGASLVGLLQIYPQAVLGVMLVVAGIGLAKAGRSGLAPGGAYGHAGHRPDDLPVQHGDRFCGGPGRGGDHAAGAVVDGQRAERVSLNAHADEHEACVD